MVEFSEGAISSHDVNIILPSPSSTNDEFRMRMVS